MKVDTQPQKKKRKGKEQGANQSIAIAKAEAAKLRALELFSQNPTFESSNEDYVTTSELKQQLLEQKREIERL